MRLLLASGLVVLATACREEAPPKEATDPPRDVPADVLDPVDPAAYPQVGDEEMGHLRWMLRLASEPVDDFTLFQARDQKGLTAYRYQIAFGGYFLALVQFHKLPAWSEAIRPAMDRLIRRLLQKPVWDYWAETSKGVPTLEPLMDQPYPELHDPVGYQNIMYSGHVGHLINLYQTLYRDLSLDEPGAIVFEWSPAERYEYSNHSLEAVMHAQMADNPYHAICCEPNAVFPECNQHPVLSFRLYDHLHGTRLYDVAPLFFEFFLSSEMTDPVTHETAMLYLVKQGWTLSQSNPKYGNTLDDALRLAIEGGAVTLESATANGWTGAFMHAWQPGFIEQQYPHWKAHHYQDQWDGTATLRDETWEPMVRHGFFALLAAEVGDLEARDRLLAWADANLAPVREDGTLHYPHDLGRRCTNLTDRTLAMARANVKDGLLRLHQEPFDDEHFAAPYVAAVDFPSVLLRRAIWDAARDALVVTTEPGVPGNGATRFEVRNLAPSRAWIVSVDGSRVARHADAGSIAVEVPLDGRHDVVVQAE